MQILFEDCSLPYLEYSGREALEGIMDLKKRVVYLCLFCRGLNSCKFCRQLQQTLSLKADFLTVKKGLR